MKTGTLYALLFDDCRLYIGATTTSLAERMQAHAYAARKGATNPYYCAWRDLGPPTCFVLWRGPVEQLEEREAHAIVRYASRHPHGYNMRAGGGGRGGLR